ncbi:glycosyltransferase family 2 protein [Granulicella cerasi]|uniref:Glycosyltransferase family 2 protein n=1 Tax=Granulicella cerasi TaxID=741063 RepID=A0ABW1ZD34_9BACT|nr:glycosyltransferase family 2 protein [Granulicella cerasi]
MLAPTLPLVLELLVLSLAAIIKPASPRGTANIDLAVIVPAHNEEKLVGACVRSILAAGVPADRIFVIAHNCKDTTVQRAAEAGAVSLPLNDDGARGKGAALFYGFDIALSHGADAVMVIDADSEATLALIAEARAAFSAGADAVQARYIAAGAQNTERQRLMALALYGFNVLRPRGRATLGLSSGIFGNGFALSRATLEAIPYTSHSLVEDLEYHLELVRRGRKVTFLDAANVFGEVPDNSAAAGTQRARWEGGRAAMRKQFAGPLLQEVLRGRIRLLEPLLDLIALPVGSGVPLLLLGLLPPIAWTRTYAATGLLALVLYVAVSAVLSGQPLAMLRALLSVPKYLVFKLLLRKQTKAAAEGNAGWVRTERND